MACTCTEDKFLYDQTTKTETPWDGVAKGIIIGRNRVMCQECIDNNARMAKEEAKQQKASQITALELKSLRKLFDGESLTEVNSERLKLRNEIKALES
jgi:membrane-bound ClpP family serine protease